MNGSAIGDHPGLTLGHGGARAARQGLPVTKRSWHRHDRAMHLSPTLAWLVDAAADSTGADRLLADLGAQLVADGVPLAAGSLTLEVPHPLIAKRTWLWRAENGRGIEALGFAPGGPVPPPGGPRAPPANGGGPPLFARHRGG